MALFKFNFGYQDIDDMREPRRGGGRGMGGGAWNSKFLSKICIVIQPPYRKLKFLSDLPGKNIWISPWITRSYVYILRSNKSNISNTFAFRINNFNHLFNCFVMEKKTVSYLTLVLNYTWHRLSKTRLRKTVLPESQRIQHTVEMCTINQRGILALNILQLSKYNSLYLDKNQCRTKQTSLFGLVNQISW